MAKRLSSEMKHEQPAELPDLLGTTILHGIAHLSASAVLFGEEARSRTARGPFHATGFYGNKPMKGGLLVHSHPAVEIATVVKGRPFFGMQDKVYHARRGDWFICGPNMPHGECRSRGNMPYEMLWFIDQDNSLLIHKTAYSRRDSYRMLSPVLMNGMPTGVRRDIHDLCSSRSVRQIRPRLLRIITWCISQLELKAPRPHSTEEMHPLITTTRDSILRSAENPPDVPELARRVGLSPNYLSSLFHHNCGMTIRAFIESTRIDIACGQLRHSKRTVKDIAYGLNFADPHHFSHAFRRVMGMSPSDYRGTVSEIQTRDR